MSQKLPKVVLNWSKSSQKWSKLLQTYPNLTKLFQTFQNWYSGLSNNRAGCNKHAGWKNTLNFGDFKDKKYLKPSKIFIMIKEDNL